MINKFNNTISSFLIMSLSIIMYIETFKIKKLAITQIGSETAPKIIAVMMFVISLLLFIISIFRIGKEDNHEKFDFEKYKKPIIIISIFIVYLLVFNKLGFIISTILYLIVNFTIFNDKTIKNFIKSTIISILISLFIYYIFNDLLNLLLPGGFLG